MTICGKYSQVSLLKRVKFHPFSLKRQVLVLLCNRRYWYFNTDTSAIVAHIISVCENILKYLRQLQAFYK